MWGRCDDASPLNPVRRRPSNVHDRNRSCPPITTSTLGDRLEALRATQQGYEDELPARSVPYLPTGTEPRRANDREFPGPPVNVKETN